MQALYVYFYQQTSRLKKDGTGTIIARITVDADRAEMGTGVSIAPEKWDKEKQIAKGRGLETIRVNSVLSSLKAKITQAYNSLAMEGTVDPDRLKAIVKGEGRKKSGLLDVFEAHNQQFEEKVKAGQRSNSTLKKYKTIKSHVSEFVNGKFVDLSKLDHVFVEDLHHFLTSTKGIKNNTTVRYIRLFGVAMRWAKKRGHLDIDVVEYYEGKRESSDPINLSEEELQAVIDLPLTDEGAIRVRDIFVFSCLTSLAYVDIKNLTADNIVKSGDKLWIVTKRQKTKVTSQTPMLPQVIDLYNKYEEHREVTDDGSILPVPTNQQCNRMLKAIMAGAGITKKITFHKGRHTFGRLMAKKNVPIAKTAKMMGHTDLRMTQLYYDITPDSITDEMDRIADDLLRSKN